MKTTNDELLLANVSRRQLLKGMVAGGGLLLAARWGVALADETKYGADAMPNGWVDDPNVFIHIATDGTITITNHRAEMGQGIRTSLVMVVADELGAKMENVKAFQAPADEKKYGNQNTDGSRSMRHWFDPMRRAAAAARTMLEQAAADYWKVPLDECHAEVEVVVHTKTQRSMSFGELADIASTLNVPERSSLKLKSEQQWRYIGKDTAGSKPVRPWAVDGQDIVTGKAIYAADMQMDGMLTAVIARPPVLGAKLASFEADKTLAVPGVIRVVELAPVKQPVAFQPLGGVAVVAENTWAAIKGRELLSIQWDMSDAKAHESYESNAYREALEQASKEPGKVIRNRGDIESALTKASQRVEASYYMPHLAQAPMEPMAAIALLKDGKAEIWTSVQNPQLARDGVAGELGLDVNDVTVNCTLLGGGFGRKAKPDYVFEAARLAKQFPGQPIRVQWTREDDIHHSYFHTVSVEYMEAGLDDNGRATGWLHRTVTPTITSIFGPDTGHLSGFELGMGFKTMPFDIPAIRLENPEAPAHVRIGWFRAVYNLPHAFAIQSFVHEMALAAGRDHREYLLELLGPGRQIDPRDLNEESWNYGEDPERYPIDIARMRGVVEKATEAAEWGRSMPKGRGLGLAMHHSFASYAAIVFDVEVTESGQLIIHSADIAYDCGPQVNPERIRSQLEGACIMGIGIAMMSEITAIDGRIQQDNFHQYLVPRMPHTPKVIRVHLINNDHSLAPGGVGEPGLPPVAPALCNAIYAASGKRVRRLPVGDQLKR